MFLVIIIAPASYLITCCYINTGDWITNLNLTKDISPCNHIGKYGASPVIPTFKEPDPHFVQGLF